MDAENNTPRIVKTPGTCSGKPRIAGRRIKVQDVAEWYELMGLSPDEIVSEHPGLTLSDVHAALAYFYDHRDEIMNQIREADALEEEMRRSNPPRPMLKRSDAHADPLSP